MITFISGIPTFSLRSYRDLINHWEIVRETLWQPNAERLQQPPMFTAPTDASAVYKEDLSLLVRATYLRSLPPPSYQRAYDHKIIDFTLATDPRITAILQTYLATESTQVALGQTVTTHPPFRGEPVNRRQLLYQAICHYPSYFFAWSAVSIQPDMDEVKPLFGESTQQERRIALERGWAAFLEPPTINPCDELSTETASSFLEPRSLLSEAEIRKLTPHALVVYAVYLNNWLDIACRDFSHRRGASQYGARVANAYSVLHSYIRRRRDVPQDLIVRLQITAIEYSFLTRPRDLTTLKPALIPPSLKSDLLEIIRQLLMRDQHELDGYDAVTLLGYLRAGSTHLRGAWTPLQFDVLVQEASQ
jgi:hypothetical protein